MDCFILEDDPMIALDIKELAVQAGLNVLSVFNHPEELENWSGEKPALALLDIHLGAKKTGIDMALYLRDNFPDCKHIFLTSYFDEATVKEASKTDPLAYLLKPFDENEVIANIELAKAKIKFLANQNLAKNTQQKNEFLFIKTSKSLVRAHPNDVLFIEAFDMYTKIYTTNSKLLASQGLKYLVPVFEKHHFIRVHRSYMVNLNAIELIQEDEITIEKHRIPIGRTYKKEFFERLNVV